MMEILYGLLTGRSHSILILVHFNSTDEPFKSSSYLTETLLDLELGHAYEPNKAAFNRAHNTKETKWSWLEHPDNRWRLIRFGAAMNGLKNAFPLNAILEGSDILCRIHCIPPSHHRISNFVGYAWEDLPQGSLVVDVGAGVGSKSFTLAQHHPQLRFLVQDRESVVGDAIEVCATNQITKPKYRIYIGNYSTGRKICPRHLNLAVCESKVHRILLPPFWGWNKAHVFCVLKKAMTSLHRNLQGKRTSLSSCSPG
jgi:hypothetical protein